MARRVGGWQRIGILLSVAWAIAGPLYLNDRVYNNALEEYGLTYHLCREAQGVPDFDPARCTERADEMQKIGMRNFAPIGSFGWALEAIVPVVLGWILAYVIVGLWRWIRAGFKPS